MQGRQPIQGVFSTASPSGSNCAASARVRATCTGDGGASRGANSAPVVRRRPSVMGDITKPLSISATGCDNAAPSSNAKCW